MGFLVRRLGFYLAAFLVAITLNYALPRMMPGDPFQIIFASARGKIQPEQMAVLKAQFGFVEGPWYLQYYEYVKSVFSWELGPSILMYPTPVSEVIGYALPWTVFLAGGSIMLCIIVGSVLGVYAAYHRGNWFDSFFSPAFLVIGAFPAIVVAMLIFYFFSLILEWFPMSYGYNPDIDPGFTWEYISSVIYHATLPFCSMFLVGIGGWLFGMRNSMINVLGEDFITMAKAKGLSQHRIRFHYAARNSILPVVSAAAMAIAFTIGGAIFIEIVFNYPGLGTLMVKAVGIRDYPLIQGLMLILVLCVLVANFMADLLYLWLDPRLRK